MNSCELPARSATQRRHHRGAGDADMAVEFKVNGRPVSFAGDASMPLLWYLRDHAQLSGTKFGCGIGACGACTVHVDGAAMRSASRR